jgi:hypothetical protein
MTDRYEDRSALRLLEELAVYAETLRAEHADPELTVKELADDLCSMDEPRHQARAEELRDRVYDGLNNVTHELQS